MNFYNEVMRGLLQIDYCNRGFDATRGMDAFRSFSVLCSLDQIKLLRRATPFQTNHIKCLINSEVNSEMEQTRRPKS